MDRYGSKTAWFAGICLCLALMVHHSPAARGLTLQLPDRAYQGDLIIGRTEPDTRVRLSQRDLPVGPEGHFVLAVARDQKKDLQLKALRAGRNSSRVIRVWAHPWQIQSIDGLPQQLVTPDADARRRIREDARKVTAVRDSLPYPQPLFIQKGFLKPVPGRVSGVFGSQRILNGVPRSPHSGIDIAAPRGESVLSPADGIVRLTAEDLLLMGNTVMLDHGLGVYSIFIHLQSIHVRVGDLVRQGAVIARVGSSGRATGPHLHWGVHVGTTAVDPLRLLRNRSDAAAP